MSARILVVDDEPDLRELLRVDFPHAGMRVETVSSVKEALESPRRSPLDLLILDRMLPDLSGEDICRWARSKERLSGLPILMLTVKEFRLLESLMRGSARVGGREQSLDEVGGPKLQ